MDEHGQLIGTSFKVSIGMSKLIVVDALLSDNSKMLHFVSCAQIVNFKRYLLSVNNILELNIYHCTNTDITLYTISIK
jgi:hypothetical protein